MTSEYLDAEELVGKKIHDTIENEYFDIVGIVRGGVWVTREGSHDREIMELHGSNGVNASRHTVFDPDSS